MTNLDWVNDGGRDAPATSRDALVIAAWLGGILLVAVVIAALVT